MSMETQDIIKRSATNSITPPPQARDYKAEVAKLIDVSTCIGCKACQVACSSGTISAMKLATASGFMTTPPISAPSPDGDEIYRNRTERQAGVVDS